MTPLLADASPLGGFPSLDGLPWTRDPERARALALQLLQSADGLGCEVEQWLAGLSEDEWYEIDHRSAEKTTHNKWFLGCRIRQYFVWLHQYRPAHTFAQSNRFAASVHNHRYAFCSLVLSGFLEITEFQVTDAGVTPNVQRTLRAGDTMSLGVEEIHKVEMVADNTLTLIIQNHESRNHSTCYYPDGSRRLIPDHTAQRPALLSSLASAKT